MQVISALVLGGLLASIESSAKFCVVVFKSPLLWYLGGAVSIGQSRVICQLLYSGMEVISALVPGGFIGQSRVICQVLCSGMQVISALVLGGLLASIESSAKFCVVVFKSPLFWYLEGAVSIGQSRVICQLLYSGMEVISALVPGGPLVKVGLSPKLGVVVFKASLLWYWGGGHWQK